MSVQYMYREDGQAGHEERVHRPASGLVRIPYLKFGLTAKNIKGSQGNFIFFSPKFLVR